MFLDQDGTAVELKSGTTFSYDRMARAFRVTDKSGCPLYWTPQDDDKFLVRGDVLNDEQAYSIMQMLACVLGLRFSFKRNSREEPMVVLLEKEDVA